MTASTWDPSQYNLFAAEREQPFWDLADLLEPCAGAKLVDLGCGDGRLTAALCERIGAASTLGIDSSTGMLAKAGNLAAGGVSFEEGDIAEWQGSGLDAVFSNAALQWVPDHPEVLARWRSSLAPGGQLAVQVPTNWDHPSHLILSGLALEVLGDAAPPDPVAANVLAPERYARLFYSMGFKRQHVRLQVYTHLLPDTDALVEWMKGTSLNRIKKVLDAKAYEDFVAEYRNRVISELGHQRPFFYPFKRILMWGRLP